MIDRDQQYFEFDCQQSENRLYILAEQPKTTLLRGRPKHEIDSSIHAI